MATKIKLYEPAISEILVPDTNSKSGAKAGGGGDGENKHEQNNNHKLQKVAKDYQPGDCLKEGTPILILLSFQPKV
jgi:hypothetical protein